MTLAVFFPSLMGVGILISGVLLVSDWIRRLLPHRTLRRRHDVVVGTYGVIADAVGAAGYHLKEPWFLKRGLRNRSTYFALTAGLAALAAGSMWAGAEFYADPLGLFYESPWAVGIGYGVGAALLVAALVCLIAAVAYRSAPRAIGWLVSESPLGRLILPSTQDQIAALNSIE
ncbi:MAG: hypothetical protein GY720_09495 [bacterium]|nr:hypothetical protein [bacterium]